MYIFMKKRRLFNPLSYGTCCGFSASKQICYGPWCIFLHKMLLMEFFPLREGGRFLDFWMGSEKKGGGRVRAN